MTTSLNFSKMLGKRIANSLIAGGSPIDSLAWYSPIASLQRKSGLLVSE